MEAKELRIGNLVSVNNGDHRQVTSLCVGIGCDPNEEHVILRRV